METKNNRATKMVAVYLAIAVALCVMGLVMFYVQSNNRAKEDSYQRGYTEGMRKGLYTGFEKGLNTGWQCGLEGGCEGSEQIFFETPTEEPAV